MVTADCRPLINLSVLKVITVHGTIADLIRIYVYVVSTNTPKISRPMAHCDQTVSVQCMVRYY